MAALSTEARKTCVAPRPPPGVVEKIFSPGLFLDLSERPDSLSTRDYVCYTLKCVQMVLLVAGIALHTERSHKVNRFESLLRGSLCANSFLQS